MTPWAAAHQAPLSMGSSRPEYCSWLPFPPPGGYLPNPGIEPGSSCIALQADSLPLALLGKRFKSKQNMKGQTGGAAGRSREWVRISPEDAHQGLPLTDPREGRRKYSSLGLREARATGSLWQRTRGWMEKQTDYFTPPHPPEQCPFKTCCA